MSSPSDTVQRALADRRAALEANPGDGHNWLSYAAALAAAGQVREALALLEQGRPRGLTGPPVDQLIAQLRARLPADSTGEAADLVARGNMLAGQARYDEAAMAYRQALALEPNYGEALGNLGNALMNQDRFDDAMAIYRQMLVLYPNSAEAYNNLGTALQKQSRFAEAIEAFQAALARNANSALVLRNLGVALREDGRIAESMDAFARFAKRAHGTPESLYHTNAPPPPHKLKHDREQRAYLAGSRGLESMPEIDAMFRLADGGRVTGHAVNPANAAAIQERWKNSYPQLVVIDNLLTPEALEKLRRFALGSTVWRKSYPDGYLGATPEYGFACPLLAQIADELREVFPVIFGEHRLRYLWGFKYDSALGGINIHADEAAVNVNFWITPDEANLDPAHGGLVVWDKVAPFDWEFASYNGDIAASRAFLAAHGARPVTIPYRANRAVLFDSDLFHETDAITFREGYENRRINITLLYGRRVPAS